MNILRAKIHGDLVWGVEMIDRKYQVCSGGVSEYELFDKSLGHI